MVRAQCGEWKKLYGSGKDRKTINLSNRTMFEDPHTVWDHRLNNINMFFILQEMFVKIFFYLALNISEGLPPPWIHMLVLIQLNPNV